MRWIPTTALLLACGGGEVQTPVELGGGSGQTTSSDPCLTDEGFEDCFTDAWCEAWSQCAFTEACEEVRPWTTHYESNDGTMSLDCEAIEPQHRACLMLPASSTCEELYEAAQLDSTNGPWIDVCATDSCV